MSRLAIIAAIGASLVLAGCGDEPGESGFPNPLLTSVPADTPYVLATGEPMDDAVTDAWAEHFRPMGDMMRTQFDQAIGQVEAEQPELAAKLSAIVDEVMALADEDGQEEIGLSRDDRLVIYGNGLMPVLRMTVSDPEAFRAFLTRLGNQSGVGMGSTTFEGREVSRLAIDPVVMLGGLHDGVLSVGVTTLDGEEALLEHLFSGEPAGETLADSGALSGLVSDYGFLSTGVGYVDIPRVTALVIGDGSEPGLLDHFDASPEALTPACRGELVSLAGTMPRLVSGYDELSESALALRSVVELDAEVAEVMSGWTVPVPGLGETTEARYAIGMSLDATKAAPDIKRWLKAAGEREFECAFLADIPWQESANKINVAPLHMVGNPKGFMFQLDELEIHDLQAQDFAASASFVGVFDNAQTLAGMARMVSPELQSLELPTDGTPVQAPSEAMQGFDQPLWLAATQTNLAAALGEGAEQRVGRVMNADAPENPPFLHFDFDAAWFYNMLADWMPRFARQAESAAGDESSDGHDDGEDGDEALSDEDMAEIERTAEMMRAYGAVLGRISYQIRFTGKGVDVATRTTLQ